MNLKFFDINCKFGNTTGPKLHMGRPDELLHIMELNSIEKAVVYNSMCVKNSIITGNKETLELVKKSGSFIGCFVLVPTIFNENGNLDSIRDTIKNSNIRFARMFPKTHNFKFSKWQIGDILDMLQQMKFPVIIDFEEMDVDNFVETKKEYRDIPVIISCTTQWANRIYPALCSTLENVYIETSNTIEYRGIEFLTQKLGADRMIFGTNMPDKEPYDSIYNLIYADISETEKEMIASGNINRIINEIRI